MARLHEYQGKALLVEAGIAAPKGRVARTAAEARDAAAAIGCPVIMKVQAWVTGRKDKGGVVFAKSPDEAAAHAERLLTMRFGNFPVTDILIEQVIDIKHELFVSLSIDDAAQAPVLLLDTQGGTGIEDRAKTVARIPVDPRSGIHRDDLVKSLAVSRIKKSIHERIADTIVKLVSLAKKYEARSFEINPLVVTKSNEVMAADCRITIDDYAVFRHPELNIEIARELDHPATPLERVAYKAEQSDHRGTFYFAQLPTDNAESTKGIIGFHGAGGGGSMMSMDAATNEGFTLANFCDTSGNPSAAKVYRAARIILSQPGLVGYFGSGSGVASQEQYHSAYGLAKAFLELNMSIPVVVRLGGNSEDRACEILHDACRNLPATIEGYKKDDTPAKCAKRFAELVAQAKTKRHNNTIHDRNLPEFVGAGDAYSFPITGGRVWIDHAHCDAATSQIVIEKGANLFKLDDRTGKPILAVPEDQVAGADSELIAREIECIRAGKSVVFVDLDIPGLENAIEQMLSKECVAS